MFKNIFIVGVLCILTIVIFGCAEEKVVNRIIYIDPPEDTKVVPPELEVTPPAPVVEDVPDVPLEPVVEDVPDVPLEPVVEDVPDVLPDELRIGDKVVAQNVNKILEDGKPHGLHTRIEPKLGDKFISGHVFDGAVGTIFDGPIDDGTYTWWRILWNLNDPNVTWIPNVADKCKNAQCFVWSVESIRGEAVLIKK